MDLISLSAVIGLSFYDIRLRCTAISPLIYEISIHGSQRVLLYRNIPSAIALILDAYRRDPDPYM